jgi:glutamine synthetase
VNKNIYHLDEAESAELGIGRLPHNLSYALDALAEDSVLRTALGDHIFEAFLAEKRGEWSEYQAQVHQWEIDRYMETF